MGMGATCILYSLSGNNTSIGDLVYRYEYIMPSHLLLLAVLHSFKISSGT
jgi:hypothetical protein